MTLYARQQERHRCKEQIVDSVGEGEGGMIWENSIERCILSYVKRIASPGSTHETGCSELVHWKDLEGWDGEGGGREVQDGKHPWLIHVNVWQKPPQYCKVISLQIKHKNKLIALHVPFYSPHSSTYVTNKSPFSHISLKETEKVTWGFHPCLAALRAVSHVPYIFKGWVFLRLWGWGGEKQLASPGFLPLGAIDISREITESDTTEAT